MRPSGKVQVYLYSHTHHKRQGLHDQAPRPYTRDTHTRQATGAEHGQAPRPYRRRAEGECRQGEHSSGASKRAAKRAALCTKVGEERVAPCPGRARQAPSPWGDHYVRASRATGRPPRRAIASVVDYRPMGAGIRRAAYTVRTPCPRALRLAPCPCLLPPAPAPCQVVCLTCGRVSCTTEPFLDLSLSVRARLGLGL